MWCQVQITAATTCFRSGNPRNILIASWWRTKRTQRDACKVVSVCACVCLAIIKWKLPDHPGDAIVSFYDFSRLPILPLLSVFHTFLFFLSSLLGSAFCFQVEVSEKLIRADMYEIIHPIPWCDVITCHMYVFFSNPVTLKPDFAFNFFIYLSLKDIDWKGCTNWPS